jgi:hypothetical protein
MDDRHTELNQLIDSSKEPSGLTLQGPHGRLYFLTDEEARNKVQQDSTLRFAYAESKKRHDDEKAEGADPHDPCARARAWLDAHSPDSEKWREICLKYLEVC